MRENLSLMRMYFPSWSWGTVSSSPGGMSRYCIGSSSRTDSMTDSSSDGFHPFEISSTLRTNFGLTNLFTPRPMRSMWPTTVTRSPFLISLKAPMSL